MRTRQCDIRHHGSYPSYQQRNEIAAWSSPKDWGHWPFLPWSFVSRQSRLDKRHNVKTYCRTTLVSLARATISFHQARQGPGQWNPAYQTYNYMMLVGAETSAAVLCACIPVARPFFLKAGQIASRSLNTSSLRAFISKTSLSSQSNKSDTYGSLSGDITKKDTISRSVEVDVDSIPLRQTSANQSFERANTLGYAEHRDPPASATAWA